MKKSKQNALSGVVAALSLLLMFCGSVIWVFTYVAPLLTGILLMILSKSVNKKSAWLTYFTVSVLSLLFFADKESALTYVFFFGFYPIIKSDVDKIKIKPLKFLIKIAVYNVGIITSQLICVFVFGIPFDMLLGKWTVVVLLLIANVIFVVYDKLLFMLSIIWNKKYKKNS